MNGAQPDTETTMNALPPAVSLSVVAESAGGAALEECVSSWFRGQGIATQSGQLVALDPAAIFTPRVEPGARIWIWLRTPTSARVFFAVQESATSQPRFLVNDVPLDHGLDELGLEQLAQKVYLSALASWAGNLESSRSEVEAGLAPLRASPPPSRHVPPAPVRASVPRKGWLSYGFGASYDARFAGPEGFVQTVAVVGTVGYRSRSHDFEVALSPYAGLLVPHRATHDTLALHLSGSAFGLDFVGGRRFSRASWLMAALGAHFDIVRSSASFSSSDLQAEPAVTQFQPFFRVRFGVRTQLGPIDLSVCALLSSEVMRIHYDVESPKGNSSLLEPWRLQPGLSLLAAWSSR